MEDILGYQKEAEDNRLFLYHGYISALPKYLDKYLQDDE